MQSKTKHGPVGSKLWWHQLLFGRRLNFVISFNEICLISGFLEMLKDKELTTALKVLSFITDNDLFALVKTTTKGQVTCRLTQILNLVKMSPTQMINSLSLMLTDGSSVCGERGQRRRPYRKQAQWRRRWGMSQTTKASTTKIAFNLHTSASTSENNCSPRSTTFCRRTTSSSCVWPTTCWTWWCEKRTDMQHSSSVTIADHWRHTPLSTNGRTPKGRRHLSSAGPTVAV